MAEEVREWRYAYEALRNVHCLRLFLFNQNISPLHACLDFAATIAPKSASRVASLLCLWHDADGSSARIFVPLPVLLLDHSVPIRFWTREDHIEVKLGLLSLHSSYHGLLGISLDEASSKDAAEAAGCRATDAKPFSLDPGHETSEVTSLWFHLQGENILNVSLYGSLQRAYERVHMDVGEGPLTDAQALESNGGFLFYCRKCSYKLTNTPFRRILELPSADWREVADHWFGNCCCASFGAHAESLVAQFQQLLIPSEGVCLVASTTCIVHKENVMGCEPSKQVPVENDDPRSPTGNYRGSSSLRCKVSTDAEIEPAGGPPVKHLGWMNCSEESSDTATDHYVNVEGHVITDPLIEVERESHGCCHSTEEVTTAEMFGHGNKVEKKANRNASLKGIAVELPATEEDEHSLAKKESQAWQIQPDRDPCRSGIRSNDRSGGSGNADRPGSGGLPEDDEVCRGSTVPENFNDTGSRNTCCGSNQCSIENSSAGVSGTDTNSGTLGNGFMTGPGGPPDICDWDPFFCYACSALVGARAKEAASSKKGVQFFKCQISTDTCHSSSNNVFRWHTVERVFTHELEANTVDTSSYRYVVRGFNSRAALLQLVLVNHDALVCSGICYMQGSPEYEDGSNRVGTQQVVSKIFENTREDSETVMASVTLQPVAKFMFHDCSTDNPKQLRSIDRWAQLQKADDIYMLEEVVVLLTCSLNANQLALPPSCATFQQFSLSFLER